MIRQIASISAFSINRTRGVALSMAAIAILSAALASNAPMVAVTATFDGSLGSTRQQQMPIVAPSIPGIGDRKGTGMDIPGTLEVGAQGGASYSIPITVPPGTAGVVPNLSLNYSSQGGNGEVGLGWSLSGLEPISRCPRDMARDSILGNVNYDTNDRFCFNGARLVPIGTYGSDGTEYRIEIESFTRVVSYGQTGAGPTYFRVWTKSGQILEFGNSNDSRDLTTTGDGTVRNWLPNKVSDHKGNYYTVTYTNDYANGQVYPSQIDYTGNAGASPYNSVKFSYKPRVDITPSYRSGSVTNSTVLLDYIRAYAGSALVSEYRLVYEDGATLLRRSRLHSVTLCDGVGNCLAPTTFDWQGTRDTIVPVYRSVASENATDQSWLCTTYNPALPKECTSYSGPHIGDFNGDGVLDYRNEITCQVMLGTGMGQFEASSINICANGMIGDANRDGITDFFSSSYEDICVDDSCSRGEVSTSYYSTVIGQYSRDFDYAAPQMQCGLGDCPVAINLPGSVSGDFNGDGCAYPDYLTPETTTRSSLHFSCNVPQQVVTLPTGGPTALFNPYTSQPYFSPAVVVADFNGDGLDDLLSTGGDTLWLSTGKGFVAYPVSLPSPPQNQTGNPNQWVMVRYVTGDWNGDGKADLMVLSKPSGVSYYNTASLYLSAGTGFTQETTINVQINVVGNAAGSNMVVGDINSDGATDLIYDDGVSANWHLQALQQTYTPELMTGIKNGLGKTTTITYDRLGNSSVYTKDNDATWPLRDISGSLYVVSRIDSSNGIGGNFSSTYRYVGAKKDFRRGFLGYRQKIETDLRTGFVTTTNYRQDFPLTGRVASQTVVSGSGVTLRSTTNTYVDSNVGNGTDGVVRHVVSLTQSVSDANDLDGTALPRTTTQYQNYDDYGNAGTVIESVSDGSSKTTTTIVVNDVPNWILDQIQTQSIRSVVTGSDVTRHMSYQHEPGSGLVTQEVFEPSDASHRVQTDYTHDPFGNRQTVTISGSDIVTRSSRVDYDARGQFPATTTNALGQPESWTYDARFGLLTSHTDLNGLTTRTEYDAFGRKIVETRPDNTKTVLSYAYCSGVNGGSASCVANGAIMATATPQNLSGSQNGPQTVVYYDGLGRSLASDIQGFDGSWIRTSTQYDAKGRVSQSSRPYFVSGGAANWTVNTYDDLGRVKVSTQPAPNGRVDTYDYHGLTASVTNDHGQSTTTVKNAQGYTASITDALSHTTTYVYDAFGNLKTITDPAGNVTTNVYDVRGKRTDSIDPDMGTWHYQYDVLGELTSQTDAKSQTTTLTYDLLGRLKTLTEYGQVSKWTYDTATNGKGKLAEAEACTSSGCGTVISDRTFTYDTQSRPYTAATTVDGNANTYTSTYNSDGRLDTLTYPSGLALKYDYNTWGHLWHIKDNSSGAVYWTAEGRDAEMHLRGETFGDDLGSNKSTTQTNTYFPNNGLPETVRAGVADGIAQFDYKFDSLGNLIERHDGLNGVFEFDCYDPLNRLHQYGVGHSIPSATCTTATINKVVEYDDQGLGNIKSKTDVGTYEYTSSRPHAVTSITGTANGALSPTYTYDNIGNMTAGAGRSVEYTAFNMATVITQGSGKSVTFAYDDQHQRLKQTLVNGTTTAVTTYLNDAASGAMSEKVVSDSVTTWREYLLVDGHIIAQHTTTSGGSAGTNWGTKKWNDFKWSSGTAAGVTSTWQYFILDNLGSVAAVVDQTGALVEQDSYDAWGKRRNFTNGSDDPSGSIRSQTTRGFTGHEHIDDVGLINMNARIYDPQLGRFMSADPITATPYDAQSLDRYTYVDNNPLTLTDPTGMEPACSERVGPLGSDGVYHCPPSTGHEHTDNTHSNETVVVTAPAISPFKNADETVVVKGEKAKSVTLNGQPPTGISFTSNQSNGADTAGRQLQNFQRQAVSGARNVPNKGTGKCAPSGHGPGAWNLTAGAGPAASVSADKHGFSSLYGFGAGGSGKVDVSVSGNIWSTGSQPSYIGLGTQSNITFGLILGVSLTQTQTPTGQSFSIDWNVPTVGLSAFAGVGLVAQTCGD